MSTIQPSIGVSQVSSAIKMANANWMAAIDQPCAFVASTGRQQLRAREHIAMERAPIRFEQHQRNQRRLDQQDLAE